MDQPNDAYTIVIFRGPTAKPLRLSFPRAIMRRIVVLGVCLILAEVLLVSQYVVRTGEVWELEALREEILIVREQTTTFSNAVEDLKRRMLAMKEINERLRVMLGIDPIKQEDMLNGRGGEETPIPTGGGEVGVGSEGEGTSGTDERGLSMPERRVSGVDRPVGDKALVLRVQNDLSWLQTEAVSQERSLEELSEVANQKSARWASTPSVWPVKGWITSGFGPRVSPFTGQPAMHDGLDIGAAPNEPVLAPAAARVTAMGVDSKMGNMVRLDHGYGFETQYAHLAKILVKNGQRVKRGDIIGLVGSTGLSTGPHLHYLVKVNNQAVNPRHYILN